MVESLATQLAYNAERIQFLVRRTAHQVMDHAWDMEDRDLT